METDSESQTQVLLCLTLGLCAGSGFSPWNRAVLSFLICVHLCPSVVKPFALALGVNVAYWFLHRL
jgi:hypothetical protein